MTRDHSKYIRQVAHHIQLDTSLALAGDIQLLCNLALETADALEELNQRIDILFGLYGDKQ